MGAPWSVAPADMRPPRSLDSSIRLHREMDESTDLTALSGDEINGQIPTLAWRYQLAFHWLVSDDAQRENRSKKLGPLRFASPGY